jgi:hypothetical protein
MAPPVKYHGPCAAHPSEPPVYRKNCKHCQAAYARALRALERFHVPIYAGLHWPAPTPTGIS